ncbi:porin [Klebsiella pneumoniae]|uniref:porin n=1 Tax=Klebsiella pneumoniae TaxID=573 RepID=UPI0034CE33CF
MNVRVFGVFFFCIFFLSSNAWSVPIHNQNGNKLYVDGRIITRHFLSSNQTMNGDGTLARLNIWGETNITNSVNSYGRFEHDFRGNKAEGESSGMSYTRFAYAGISAFKYGNLDYGRNNAIMYDIVGWTDIFPVWGASSFKNDNFLVRKGNGLLSYHNHNFFSLVKGIDFGLQYQGKNESNSRSVLQQNGDGYGASISYRFADSGIVLGGGYTSSQRTFDQKELSTGHGDKAEAWIAGAKFTINPFYFAGFYSESHNLTQLSNNGFGNKGFANKAQHIELVASWESPWKLITSMGYIQSKAKDVEGIGNAWIERSLLYFIALPLNSHFRFTAEYNMSLLSDNNILHLANDDVLALSMIYDF